MKYDIPWLFKNLGITRKTVIEYYATKNGFLIPDKGEKYNKEFTAEEVQWIWIIKTLVGLGYSHNSIKEMIDKIKKGEEIVFEDGAKKAVERIERKIGELKRNLETAKFIEKTGRLPMVREIGEMPIKDFIEYAQNTFSFKNSGSLNVMKFLTADATIEDLNEDEENYRLVILSARFEGAQEIFYKRIIKEKDKAQEIINEFYEYTIEYFHKLGNQDDISKYEFSYSFSPMFFEGELGKHWDDFLGRENRIYINKEMAIFGNRSEYEGINVEYKIKEI